MLGAITSPSRLATRRLAVSDRRSSAYRAAVLEAQASAAGEAAAPGGPVYPKSALCSSAVARRLVRDRCGLTFLLGRDELSGSPPLAQDASAVVVRAGDPVEVGAA